MAVRKFKPVTPGTRHKIAGTFEEVTKSAPEKSLLEPKKLLLFAREYKKELP